MVPKNERSFYFVPIPPRKVAPIEGQTTQDSDAKLPTCGQTMGGLFTLPAPHWGGHGWPRSVGLTQQHLQAGLEFFIGLTAPATATVAQQTALDERHQGRSPDLGADGGRCIAGLGGHIAPFALQ